MNDYIVTFSPLALTDIEEAIVYYESIRKGLGVKFNSNLQTSLNAIKRNALFASVRYDDIRCTQVKKFPYLIHYHVDKEKIVTVVAVYSSYREPFWEP